VRTGTSRRLTAPNGESLDWDQAFAVPAMVLLAALTLAGVRPRLAEYR
jgi:hypothetical protein